MKKVFGSKKAPEKVFGLKQAENVAARVKKFDMPTLQACLLALEVPNTVAADIKSEIDTLGAENINDRKVNEAITSADAEDDKVTKAEIAKITAERANRKAKNDASIQSNDFAITMRIDRITALENIAHVFAEPPLGK